LLPLLCLVSVYYLLRGLGGGGWMTWLGHGLATLAMLLTHNWSWLVLIAEGVAVGGYALWRGWRRAVSPGLTWLVVLACYAPWAPSLLDQCRHAGHDAWNLRYVDVVFVFFESTTATFADHFSVLILIIFLGLIWHAERGGDADGLGRREYRWKLLI